MTWETVATDGNVIGKISFLKDYWLGNFRNKCSSLEQENPAQNYSLKQGRITGISPEHSNPSFEVYAIAVECEGANNYQMILSQNLRPMVKTVLGLNENDSLENCVISCYLEGTTLKGFSKH